METCVVRRINIPVDGIGTDVVQRTVLLVTADADLREVTSRMLEAGGYRIVKAAHSGHAVLACLKGGRIDVLVAELVTEEMSGPKLAERLRRHHPGLQTLFFANAGTPACEGLLVRPFTRDELLSQLTNA